MNSKLEIDRELAQKVDDLLYIMTGHDSYPCLVHKYGKEWWTPINEMRAEICTLLAAPVVERKEPVGYSYKEYVWATGLGAHVWREKLETERPNTEESEVKDLVPLYAEQPAPVAVMLPSPDDLRYLISRAAKHADLTNGANFYTAAELAAEALIDKVKELNQ